MKCFRSGFYNRTTLGQTGRHSDSLCAKRSANRSMTFTADTSCFRVWCLTKIEPLLRINMSGPDFGYRSSVYWCLHLRGLILCFCHRRDSDVHLPSRVTSPSCSCRSAGGGCTGGAHCLRCWSGYRNHRGPWLRTQEENNGNKTPVQVSFKLRRSFDRQTCFKPIMTTQ